MMRLYMQIRTFQRSYFSFSVALLWLSELEKTVYIYTYISLTSTENTWQTATIYLKFLELKSGKRKQNTCLRTKPDETATHQYMPRGPNMKSFTNCNYDCIWPHRIFRLFKWIGCLKRRSSPKGFLLHALGFDLSPQRADSQKYQFCYPDNPNRCVVSLFFGDLTVRDRGFSLVMFGLSVQQRL